MGRPSVLQYTIFHPILRNERGTITSINYYPTSEISAQTGKDVNGRWLRFH